MQFNAGRGRPTKPEKVAKGFDRAIEKAANGAAEERDIEEVDGAAGL